MNERIKQLAEQVDKEFNSPYDRHKAIERFAELIVKECSNVAWQHTPETEELEYSHLIKDKILAHFGVEE